MTEIILTDSETYLHPTPAGAFYCVSGAQPTPARLFLGMLLRQERSPRLDDSMLMSGSGIDDVDQARRLLFHAQKLGWIQGFSEPRTTPDTALESLLPELLSALSVNGRVLLADEQGFYLATAGFPHEVAEELSALSADLASLHARRAALLEDNLGLSSGAWAIVDAAGNGRIGFWPLFVGSRRFVLVVSGLPRFNCTGFVTLAAVLCRRYSDVPT